MRLLILLHLCLVCTVESLAQRVKFLINDTTEGNRHQVYIDTDPFSRNYDQLSSIIQNELDIFSYENGIEAFGAAKPKPLMRHARVGLPEDWTPVYNYEGSLYLYLPCDWGTQPNIKISDSTIALRWMDGYEVQGLKSCEITNGEKWELVSEDPQGKQHLTSITILNYQTQLALFDNHDATDEKRYWYMVSRNGQRYFPLIVNSCPDTKVPEWTFELADRKKLNRKYRQKR